MVSTLDLKPGAVTARLKKLDRDIAEAYKYSYEATVNELLEKRFALVEQALLENEYNKHG